MGLTNVRMIPGRHSFVEHNILEGPRTKIIGLYGPNVIVLFGYLDWKGISVGFKPWMHVGFVGFMDCC